MGGSLGICEMKSRAVKGLAECDKIHIKAMASDITAEVSMPALSDHIVRRNPSPQSELLN